MSRFLLIRHAQSTWNAEGRWQGWADPPLSGLGKMQAGLAADWFWHAGFSFARVVSSDLLRASETAAVIATRLGLQPVIADASLRERDVGEWEGLTRQEISDRWPGMLEDYRGGSIGHPPGGEPPGAFVERIYAVLRWLSAWPDGSGPSACPGPGQPGLPSRAARSSSEAFLLITHAGVIRALERSVSAEQCEVTNLNGRWFELDGSGDLVPGGPGGVRAPRRL